MVLLPNKFDKEMDKIIAEFPENVQRELSLFYLNTLKKNIQGKKITKNVIYSLHTAHKFKKYLHSKTMHNSKKDKENDEYIKLVKECMKIKAKEYRTLVLSNLDNNMDYASDKDFIYSTEQWMQSLVKQMREDLNLNSQFKLRKEILNSLHEFVMQEIDNIFLGFKKFGQRGITLLINLAFYEKHVFQIDDDFWDKFINNFKDPNKINLRKIKKSVK